jgi:hypothetical protein
MSGDLLQHANVMSYRTAAKHSTKRVCALQPKWERLHLRARAEEISHFSSFRIVVVVSRLHSRIPSFIFRLCLRFHAPRSRHPGFGFIAKPCCLHPRYPRHVFSRRYHHTAILFLGRHVSMYPHRHVSSYILSIICILSPLSSFVIAISSYQCRVALRYTSRQGSQELPPREGPTVMNALS